MRIGYARSSTIDQEAGFQAQLKALEAAGCNKVFSEKVSSVAEREQLEAALDYVREGDSLVVTKLDRLARSVSYLVAIGERLEFKGVALKGLEQAIDTSTSTGRLMFNMLGAIAQFERELMLERQREGVARPRRTGSTKAGPLQHVPKHPRCYGCIVKGSDQLRLPSGSVSGAHLCIAS